MPCKSIVQQGRRSHLKLEPARPLDRVNTKPTRRMGCRSNVQCLGLRRRGTQRTRPEPVRRHSGAINGADLHAHSATFRALHRRLRPLPLMCRLLPGRLCKESLPRLPLCRWLHLTLLSILSYIQKPSRPLRCRGVYFTLQLFLHLKTTATAPAVSWIPLRCPASPTVPTKVTITSV